jgi:hypothetical protein
MYLNFIAYFQFGVFGHMVELGYLFIVLMFAIVMEYDYIFFYI